LEEAIDAAVGGLDEGQPGLLDAPSLPERPNALGRRRILFLAQRIPPLGIQLVLHWCDTSAGDTVADAGTKGTPQPRGGGVGRPWCTEAGQGAGRMFSQIQSRSRCSSSL